MKYRKKPVVIEAVRWTGLNLEDIKDLVGEDLEYDIQDAAWECGKGTPQIDLRIKTMEGTLRASVGDYIIRGVQGEFYPCKPDVFEQTYEREEEGAPVESLGWTAVDPCLLCPSYGKCIWKGWNCPKSLLTQENGE